MRMKSNGEYRAGLYLRLSKDDEGSGESASITNQRSILRAFAKENSIPVAGEYIDDGFSGTNFDRPDFNRLITDIGSGKIDCVIVKDLSRLGRNSSKATELLEEFFPSRGVRFLSVADGFDSAEPNKAFSLATPFLLLAHEVYARDISAKIRSSQRAKMLRGECIAAFAPYGYRKSEENKNRLVVDPQAAAVVRRIFAYAAEGRGPGEIARILNADGVPTPAEYRCRSRPYLNVENYTKRREWTSSGICKMLRNRVYLGELQQGKSTKVSFKSRRTQAVQRDEWVTVKGAHEPIVGEDVFELVQKRAVSRRNGPGRGFRNIFSGIAVCADCGRNMSASPSRRKGSVNNLCCGGYKNHGSSACSNHFIDYEMLRETVLRELKLLRLSDTEKELIVENARKNAQKTQRSRNRAAQQTLEKKQRRMNELAALILNTYEDGAFGRLSETLCHTLLSGYGAETERLKSEIDLLQSGVRAEAETAAERQRLVSMLAALTEPEELTAGLLKRLVDRIEIGQGEYIRDKNGRRRKKQSIKIFFRFACPPGTLQ